MSCGTPKCASTRLPSAESATACASVMHASDPSAVACGAWAGTVARSSTRSVPPPGSARTATALSPSRRSTTRPSSTAEVVRVDHPRHDGLAQPRARVEHRAGAPPAHRVRGEQHPGDLRVDHPLDHHREPHLGVVDPEVGAVGDGAVRPQRGPAAAHGVEERLAPHDVQVGVLLAGETGRGQVLGGGRRPDRHRHVRLPGAGRIRAVVPGTQAAVGRDDGRRDVVGQRRGAQQLARSHGIGGVDAGRSTGVRRRGHAEPAGHRQPRGDQLAEVRRLPAHRRQVRGPQLPEVPHQRRADGGRRSGALCSGHTSR